MGIYVGGKPALSGRSFGVVGPLLCASDISGRKKTIAKGAIGGEEGALEASDEG